MARQTQEIGVRMALGASAHELQWSAVGSTLRMALSGVAAGTLPSLAVARPIASLLFGVSPDDPTALTGVVLLLGPVSPIAG